MKSRMWIALTLAAALAIPAAAQQSSSQSGSQASTPAATQSAQPANQNAAEPSQSSDQATSQRQPLQLETHEGFWGKINPFARKKYVQRQLGPVTDRVNELDELTAANSKAIKDVDSRAQEGIRMASAKASEADSHAVDAGNRAQAAQQTAQQTSTRLTTVEQVVNNIDQYKPVTQAEIRFRPGQTVLSAKAKQALDEIATPLKDQKGYIIEVQGFSQGRGSAAIEASQRMADAVVRYLVINHEIPVYRIYVLGMGNASLPAAEGSRPQRVRGARVDVSLLKNDLEQLTSAQPISGGNSMMQGGMSGAAASSSEPSQAAPASSNPASNTQTPSKPVTPHQQ